MNLDFSDDQKFLQEEARKFLEKENSISRSRSVLESNNKVDKELWNKIVDLGWTGIRIPEQYDGLGLGHLELCVVAEELGRFLAHLCPFLHQCIYSQKQLSILRMKILKKVSSQN